MLKILTPQDKATLRLVSNYLRSQGLKEGTIDIDLDWGTFDSTVIENISTFSNSYNVEIPQELTEVLKKILLFIEDEGLIETPNVDDLNYERVTVQIDTIDKSLTVEHYWTYYDVSEHYSTEFSERDYEDEDPNPITEIFDLLEANPDVKPKRGILTLRYNGSGDSGYLEDFFEEGGNVTSEVEDWCYRQLENQYGGWEINEGSQGEFIFDINNNTIQLHHSTNTEETETDTVYEEKF